MDHEKRQESSRKNIYFCFINYAKAFDCVDHNKLENSERDGNTRPPDLPLVITCYARNCAKYWVYNTGDKQTRGTQSLISQGLLIV